MEIAEFYLEEAGAQVTKAWNGREAAELFKQSGQENMMLFLWIS